MTESIQAEDDSPAGEYRPFSLTLRLRESVFDRPRNLSMYEQAPLGVTEAHEALHFFQETTTAFGLLSWIGYLGACIDVRARVIHQARVVLPVDLSGACAAHWAGWWQSALGDRLNQHERIVGATLHPPTMRVNLNDFGVVPLYGATGTTAEDRRFCIGALAVQESCARQIELLLARGRVDFIPSRGGEYQVLEDFAALAASRDQTARVSPELLATVADHSLQSLTPGYFALSYIDHFLAADIDIEVACAAVDRLHQHSPGALLDYCASSLDQAEAALKATLPCEPHFPWILQCLRQGLRLRQDRPWLLRDVVRDENGPWHALLRLIEQHQVPVAIDRDERFVALGPLEGPKDDLPSNSGRFADALVYALLLVLSQEPETRCPFFSGCAHRFKNEEECTLRPWTRAQHLKTCSVGHAFRVLGFEKQEIVVPRVAGSPRGMPLPVADRGMRGCEDGS